MTVKKGKISSLIAWFVVWVAPYLPDVIGSLFWLEYDPGNLKELKKRFVAAGLEPACPLQTDLYVCLEMMPFVSPHKIKCLQRAHCTHKIIH